MRKIEKSSISLPDRKNITNKGDAGRVLVIGGDIGMCGAAAFASEASYRSGCGLVKAYVHPENRIPMQISVPEAVLSFWEGDADKKCLRASLEWADAVLVGVGFGRGDIQESILDTVFSYCEKTLVIDADALNILADNKKLFSRIPENAVLTPHLAELSRLVGEDICKIKSDVFYMLEKHFSLLHINVVAKSNVTHIRFADGEQVICSSGNSSLSTGGTGDILAGMTASFLAQKMTVKNALSAAVFLHGEAGKRAGEKLGERGVIARDVIYALPEILKEY